MGSLAECSHEYSHTPQTIQSGTFKFESFLTAQVTDISRSVLLATIRDKGLCPCPRCLVPMDLIHKMGTRADMQRRIKTLRRDNLSRQKLIRQARSLIFNEGKAVGNDAVNELLQSESLVPTEVRQTASVLTCGVFLLIYYALECLLAIASALKI